MTAPIDQIDGIKRRLSSVVGKVLLEEVEKLRVPAPRVEVARPDAEIMRACRKVAAAYDALQQAKYAGLQEVRARRALELAAKSLETVMRRHGRMG